MGRLAQKKLKTAEPRISASHICLCLLLLSFWSLATNKNFSQLI